MEFLESGPDRSACRVLSRGSASDVFELWRDGRPRVVKVLHASASAEDRARFTSEAEALASVASPHVVRVERVLTDARGLRALVMPRLAGRTLARWMEAWGPLPAPHAAQVFAGVLAGLQAVHARGIVHRDVKPTNVFIGREHDEPPTATRGIVIDLGLATSASRSATTGRHVVGSARYLAPEQILAGRVDARTDVWGASVSLLEALTGTRAFPGDDPALVLTRDPFDALTRHQRSLALPFHGLLQRGLEKRPDARFSDVEQMRAALIDAARGVS